MTNLSDMMTGLSEISTVGREDAPLKCAATASDSSGTPQRFIYLCSPDGAVRDLKEVSAPGG